MPGEQLGKYVDNICQNPWGNYTPGRPANIPRPPWLRPPWLARPQLGQLHPRGTLRSHFASKAAILASFDYLGGTLTVCTPVGGTIHGRG